MYNPNSETDIKLISTTLESILKFSSAPSVIDFLSLDVEGHEYYVFKSFDFSLYKFLVMSIERPKHKLHHLLASNGYWWIHTACDFGDVIYLHESHPKFHELIAQYRPSATTLWENDEHPYLLKPPYFPKA